MVLKEFGSFAEGFHRGMRGERLKRSDVGRTEKNKRRKKRSTNKDEYNGL